MTLNGEMANILRFITELGSFRGILLKSGWRYTQTLSDKNVVASSLHFEGYISQTVQDSR